MFPGRRFFVRISTIALIFSILPATSSNANAATSYLSSGSHYAYESFSTSGSWTRPFGVTQIDYLVVAGGGRGGGSQLSTHFAGGGGGGGGVRSGTLTVGQSTYTVTVGSGQAIGCSQGRGGNSSLAGTDITTISATGGGSGSCNSSTSDGAGGIDGYSGGSGGGAGAQVNAKTFGSGNAGNYSPAEGYAGGTAILSTTDAAVQAGGGGGGASQDGTNATSGTGGKGGNGITSSITGTSLVYGSGGGGGTRFGTGGGVAGTGGGGSGGLNGAQGTAGTDGRGGGGGGTSLYNGNKGGDGIVIIRFLVTAPSTPNLPDASDSGLYNSDNLTNLTSFSLTGTAIGGASVQIYDGSSTIGSPCTANMSTGIYSCALSGLTAGAHTFTAKASYGGGTENSSSGSLTVVIDTTAPSLTGTSSVNVAENSSSSQTLRASETSTITFGGVYDKAQFTLDTMTGLLNFAAHDFENPFDSDLNNQYYINIIVRDLAGNNASSYNFFYTVTNVAESASLGLITLSTIPKKGNALTLTISSDVSGKITFYANGKRISGCISLNTSGNSPSFSGQCTWKPTTTAPVSLSATVASPTSAFLATSSSPVLVRPISRTIPR